MKICGNCGTSVADNVEYCPNCGTYVGISNQQNQYQQPTYQQPVYQQPVYQQPVSYVLSEQQQMNKDIETAYTLGIVTLVLAILGLLSPEFIFSIVGIVTGFIGKSKIKPYKNGKDFPDAKAKTASTLNKAGIAIIIIAAVVDVLIVIGGIILYYVLPFGLFYYLDEVLG